MAKKTVVMILLGILFSIILGSVALGVDEPFKFKITTTLSPQTFSFQTDNAVDLFVDWGDGNNDTYSGTGLRSHSYATAGDYNISLTGQASRISFYEGTEDLLKDILTPMSNSVTGITSAYEMFRDASGITTFTAEDFFDDVSGNVTNMQHMFLSASSFFIPSEAYQYKASLPS